MVTVTHNRTHTFVEFSDPYLVCEQCRQPAAGFHDPARCGPVCEEPHTTQPCGHPSTAGITSTCPSWGPVDGCTCLEILGVKTHGPGRDETINWSAR